jgi:hypothetical protein
VKFVMSKSPKNSLSFPAAIAALLVAVTACKGATVVKDNPEIASKLTACDVKSAEKDKVIVDYEAQLAKLKLASGGSTDFTIVLEGDALTIKSRPASGGSTPPVDDKVAIELSQKFIDMVRKSRGSIQKCYEGALKKNSSLQARTISMTVTAKYGSAGDVSKASFRPDTLGTAFDSCMQGVAKNWKLPATAAAMSFQSTVTLSPS